MTVLDSFSLHGKTALITGGSRGLGKDMAIGLGEAGATVCIAARREQWLSPAIDELAHYGITAYGKVCDVTDEGQVDDLVQFAVEKMGQVDILIAAAGITWAAPAEEMTLDDVDRVLRTNITGTFLVTQRVGRAMIRRGCGKVILISSVAGSRGLPSEILDATAYSASNAAIDNMTMDLAVKWARFGIYVNAIAPGWFPTRMAEPVLQKAGNLILERTPMKRFGQGAELRGVACFLSSDASSYVTGQVIRVDGGMSSW